MPQGAPLNLLIILVLLMLSAFFSSSEAAFLSLQKSRIAHMISTNVPGARRVAEMVGRPDRLLSTILLGNNLVNIAFTAIITVLAVDLFGQSLGVAVATAGGTAIVLIFGEILPKTIAVRFSERMAFAYSRPLKWTEILLWPLVMLLQWITRATGSLLGGPAAVRESITEGELRTLIDIGEAEGTFESAEAEMLENVFRFGDRQVREVMTPRPEIVSIESTARLRQFLEMYAAEPHTRFPVYKGDMDNIIGIISAKDVLRVLATRGLDLDQPITDMMRDAFFVPETKRIAELFDEMRRSGNQMAIAVDEYGGLAGLVTLKRLSEEVVGPVGEEGEGPEEEYQTIDENTFDLDAGMSIEEANEEMELGLPEGDFDTVAGFVLDVLGHIPAEGEQFEYNNLRFEITQMKDLRIERVRITRLLPPQGDMRAFETDSGQARGDAAE